MRGFKNFKGSDASGPSMYSYSMPTTRLGALYTCGWPLYVCVYGDPAYPHCVHLQAPFRNRPLFAEMEAFNKSMSRVRVTVEWLFGDIVNYFRFMDFKKNLKIDKLYVFAAILRNALTCMQPNNTSKFFELEPPTVEEGVFQWRIQGKSK